MRNALILAALLMLSGTTALAQMPQGAMTTFPHRNGPLSALMLIIPANQVEEFDKPTDQPPRIIPAASAKVGDAVAIKIMFSGPQIDASGGVDVTYDLQILAPDGSFYSGVDHRGLEAIKLTSGLTSGMEKSVFDNRAQTVAIGFEPQDQAGLYRVRAVLHDNIGRRDIPLTAQIELQK